MLNYCLLSATNTEKISITLVKLLRQGGFSDHCAAIAKVVGLAKMNNVNVFIDIWRIYA
jgi:hypothetical protein